MSADGEGRKQGSCLGFLLWCVGALVLFAVVVVAILWAVHHFSDDSRYSARVSISTSNVSGGSRDTSLWLTYQYSFRGKTYKYSGEVGGSSEHVPDTACVDPKHPADNLVLDESARDPGFCGNKRLAGIPHTAHLVRTTGQ